MSKQERMIVCLFEKMVFTIMDIRLSFAILVDHLPCGNIKVSVSTSELVPASRYYCLQSKADYIVTTFRR